MGNFISPKAYSELHGKTVIEPVVPNCSEAEEKAQRSLPYRNLTALVRAHLKTRGIDPDTLSPDKFQKYCREIAASATNRPDLKARTWLSPDLAYALNLHLVVQNRLLPHLKDPADIADFFLEHIADDNLDKQLRKQGLKLPAVQTLLHLKEEFGNLLGTTHTYLRNSPLDGHNINGELLTHTIVSSADRSTQHVQNMRVEASTWDQTPIAYTGRVETEEKAKEQAATIIRTEVASGRTTWEELEQSGFDYVITSFLNTDGKEGKLLKKEEATLKALYETTLDIDGHIVCLRPLLFSRQASYQERFEKHLDKEFSGKKVSEEINQTSFAAFKTYILQKIQNLDPEKQEGIQQCLTILETQASILQIEEEILLREIICKVAKIPSVFHCLSSKDRTALVGLALSAALQKWLNLSHYENNSKLFGFPKNPLDLLQDERFKELILLSLPPNHQLTASGLGGGGVVNGAQMNDRLGFRIKDDGENWYSEPDVLTRILPKRLLQLRPDYILLSLVGAFYYAIICFLQNFIYAIGITLEWALRLYEKGEDVLEAWDSCTEAWTHIFLFWQGVKTHIVKKDKIWNGEYPLIYEKVEKTKIAPQAEPIVQTLDNLSTFAFRRLKHYLKAQNPDPKDLSAEDRSLLLQIGNNFELLKEVARNPDLEIMPRVWLMDLLKICEASPIALFRLPQYVTLPKEVPLSDAEAAPYTASIQDACNQPTFRLQTTLSENLDLLHVKSTVTDLNGKPLAEISHVYTLTNTKAVYGDNLRIEFHDHDALFQTADWKLKEEPSEELPERPAQQLNEPPSLKQRMWTSLTAKEPHGVWKTYRWTVGRVNQLFFAAAWGVIAAAQLVKALGKHTLLVLRFDLWGHKVGFSEEFLKKTFPKGVTKTELLLCLLAFKASLTAFYYFFVGPRREQLNRSNFIQIGPWQFTSPILTAQAWKAQANLIHKFCTEQWTKTTLLKGLTSWPEWGSTITYNN
jgi:hypothetical protein